MSIYFSLFLFLLSLPSHLLSADDWKQIPGEDDIKDAYVHTKYSTSVFTVLVKKDEFKLQDFNDLKYIASLPVVKEVHNKILGITSWKIISHKTEKNEKLIVVKIQGEYYRGQTKVIFEEWHHFQSGQFIQLQMIKNHGDQIDASTLFLSAQKKWLL